jgi:hypothetical protein
MVVAALLVAGISYVTLAQEATSDIANGAANPVGTATKPAAVALEGVPASEIPAFPSQLVRADVLRAIARMPYDCKGQTPAETAEQVDVSMGDGQTDTELQALLNLVLTESALSIEETTHLVFGLGRYENGAAALGKVAAFAHQIAVRQYKAQQSETRALRDQYGAQLDVMVQGGAQSSADAVTAALERDLLVAAIEATKVAPTPDRRRLVEELAGSAERDVARTASQALASW